jgi:hypothetical protein
VGGIPKKGAGRVAVNNGCVNFLIAASRGLYRAGEVEERLEEVQKARTRLAEMPI